MSVTLDLTVPGDPSACRSAATELAGVTTTLGGTSAELSGLVGRAARAWTGVGADAFVERLDTTRKNVDELTDRLEALGRAVESFAGELDVVRCAMADARATAVAGDLVVRSQTVLRPADQATTAADTEATKHAARVTAWNSAVAAAEDARIKETSAHEALATALAAAAGDGWLEELLGKLGFAPPDQLGAPAGGLWGLDRLGLAFGAAADWMIKGRYGTFQPRVGGQFASPGAFSAWQRGLLSLDADNWHALPYAAGTRNAWATAGRWAGRAGAGVSFGTAAWDQWSQDTDDPTMSTSERAGRSVTVGATTAAGAWGGAWLGAQAGGAIGTMICPGVGTVIGGALGGIIGGFAGSELGGMVGDALKDAAGEAAEAVTDFVGDAADAIGDVAGDLGDALTFWD